MPVVELCLEAAKAVYGRYYRILPEDLEDLIESGKVSLTDIERLCKLEIIYSQNPVGLQEFIYRGTEAKRKADYHQEITNNSFSFIIEQARKQKAREEAALAAEAEAKKEQDPEPEAPAPSYSELKTKTRSKGRKKNGK